MRLLNREKRTWDKCIFLMLFLIFFLIIFYIMGILDSGYHFVDDHEFVRYNKSLLSEGLVSTLITAVKNDMLIRFRFTYTIIRVLESYLFPNFIALHIFQTLLVALAFYLSYIFARMCGCSILLSCILPLIIYIGPQAEVWWRLGPQENLGVLFLMLTLTALIRYMNTTKKVDLFIVAILIFFLGGTKESFLVLIPVLPLFMVWYSLRKEGLALDWTSVKVVVRKYKSIIGWCCVVFGVDILFILCVVGTNKIGYAGIDSNYGLGKYISNVMSLCAEELKPYIVTTICLIILVTTSNVYIAIKQKKYHMSNLWILEMAIFLFVFATQLVLHAKSGIFLRYFIPSTIGFGLLWTIFLADKARGNKIVKCIYNIVIIMGISKMIWGSDVWEKGVFYADNGKNTEAVMQEIASYSDREPTVVSAMASELDLSLSIYLQEVHGMDAVYGVYCSEMKDGMVSDGYRLSDIEKESMPILDADIYITYEGNDGWQELVDSHGLKLDEYIRQDFGRYYLYVSKNY